MAATKGSQNLNRILRLTANLLFEKGQSASEVSNLLSGFVEPRQVRKWMERYQEVNGFPAGKIGSDPRIPVPPIDWNAVKIESLKQINEAGLEAEKTPMLSRRVEPVHRRVFNHDGNS